MENKTMFNDTTDLSAIPADAYKFVCEAQFDTFEQGADKNKLRLQFYDGSVNKHWYWGNFAFDLSSIKLAKNKVGVFDSHDTQKRLGVGTKLVMDGNKAFLEGSFLDNSQAVEVKKDALQGFPFEASMSFDPDKARIEYIKDGQTTEINGHTLKGPGTVISNTIVREVSICAFGALKNCSTEVFNKNNNLKERDNKMSEQKVLTIDSLKAEHAEIYKAAFDAGMAEGEKKERDFLKKLTEQFSDDPDFVLEQFNKAVSMEAAAFAYIEKTKQKIVELSAKKVEAPKVEIKTEADPAVQEFKDDIKPEAKIDLNDDKALRTKYEADTAIQSEFWSAEAYIGHIRAEAAGMVRTKK